MSNAFHFTRKKEGDSTPFPVFFRVCSGKPLFHFDFCFVEVQRSCRQNKLHFAGKFLVFSFLSFLNCVEVEAMKTSKKQEKEAAQARNSKDRERSKSRVLNEFSVE